MKKEIILFQKDELTFKYKFYTLMDILISNQASSRFEAFLLMGIFYLQIISSFFSEKIEVFDSENAISDRVLNYIQKIFRIKGLFQNNKKNLTILKYILFIILILAIIHFIISCNITSRKSFYSWNNRLINYYIKIFIYIGYNIIFDISFSYLYFGSNNLNSNFTTDYSPKNYMEQVCLSIFFIIISLCIYIFISIYYNDSFYLSNSFYAKMTCNYDIFWGFNCLVVSLLSSQAKFISKEIFLLYNLIISIIFFTYYLKHYLYYDKYINIFTGIFHILYIWTSIFCLIFAFLKVKEKGIIYIITSIFVGFFYLNINNRMESKIFLETPYHKIENKYYILYYLRTIIEKINNIEESYEDKSFLSSIIKIHSMECPNMGCLLKIKEDLYLPLNDKWLDKRKEKIEDEVFLKNFIVIIMNYFLSTHDCSVDMYLNLSLYQLKIIGNYCQAMYYYKKVSELKLSLKEYFSLIRLNIQISKELIRRLKPSNEQCLELENLDISQYFKYDLLSQNFLDEINNDINLSLEFWNSFRDPLKEQNKKIDFNKVFILTNKIRITKKNIENMWNELFKIYEGINDYFFIYMNYVEQINDDDLKRRDLEIFKRKNDNIGEHININYYSILFNKETGIIIANGDKGNEGLIQLANYEIENIFKCKSADLKGMNISSLMPKIFAINHSKYMERYFKIGEKKFIEKSVYKSFGKDINNYIIKIKLALKLFPILNENVFFAALIQKENIDDIILLDNQFNIQGMSSKLMRILGINNKYLFQNNEIPFYVICKKFVNFYNIFLKGKQKKFNLNREKKPIIEEEEDKKENKDEKDYNHDNIEINENVELEYEIKLPKFLIDYSEKTNKNETKFEMQLMQNNIEIENINDKNNDDENESLLKSEKNNNKKIKSKESNNNINQYNTPTPMPTPTPTPTPTPEDKTPNGDIIIISNSIISKEGIEKNIDLNKICKEEKIYINKMSKYKTLFSEEKFDELEELIDNCNKNSNSIEYKFNFTFDKYIYGNKQISYIVRCVDNENEIGKSEEESDIDPNPRINKYKKEKNESIKPLFELFEEEKKELVKLPEEFLKLSLENKKFQKLLEICKNDLNNMSKAYGHKKVQILDDENSSQSSQAGYDSGLVKKNRIEEIRNNLMKNISSFYTLKYIKLVILLIAIVSISFSFLYIFFFIQLNKNLKNSFLINITIFESTIWTSEIINIFISLRILYKKNIIKNITDFDFFDYFSNTSNINLAQTNIIYYNEFIKYTYDLYNKTYVSMATLEMEIANILNEDQLDNIFWDKVSVTYMNEEVYYKYINGEINELFPLSLAQLLSNTLTFIENNAFNSIDENALNLFNENIYKNSLYFNYNTYLIIENGYDNILPNLFKKLSIIPNILKGYNLKKISGVIIYICFYICSMFILFFAYIFLLSTTSKSITNGIKKITKIKLEKMEEIIKKIKLFSINLKKYREKDLKIEENKYISEISDNNLIYEENIFNINEKENKNKLDKESSLVNNNGFNTDYKKYIPLNVLNSLIYPPLIFSIIICLSLVPIYHITLTIIKNTNLLILVQNYIFGKIIKINSQIIELKCFISECQNKNDLDYSSLVDMSLIHEIIKGINIIPTVVQFYNEKFLLNACEAAIDKDKNPELYQDCLIDPLIIAANNSDNLIKLIEDHIYYIRKEYENKNKSEPNYNKLRLFNSSRFMEIEYIYCKYIYSIGGIFRDLIFNGLINYLESNKLYISLLIISLGILNISYSLIYGIIIIKKLIYNLTISRCIIKIIPISAILNTQELETWIENKY